VVLVAGGRDNNLNRISSTEVLTMDSPGWALTTPLPKAMDVVRGVTAGGMFYITGKLYGTDCNIVRLKFLIC
jgi:hypothetical protein